VRTGSQSDARFLQSLFDEFGAPDVVLDRGARSIEDIATTFEFFYSKLPANGIYMVEDRNTSAPHANMPRAFLDGVTREGAFGQLSEKFIAQRTFGISFYDNIVVLEKSRL
jgi:hypothetical protein